MSISRKLLAIKDEIADATANKTRAEGALEQSMKRLRSDFDCKSRKQAVRLRDKFEEQAEKAETDLSGAIRDLEKQHGDI